MYSTRHSVQLAPKRAGGGAIHHPDRIPNMCGRYNLRSKMTGRREEMFRLTRLRHCLCGLIWWAGKMNNERDRLFAPLGMFP